MKTFTNHQKNQQEAKNMKKRMTALALGSLLTLSIGLSACGGASEYGDRTPVRLWCQPFTEKETQVWLQDHVDDFNQSEISTEGGFYIDLTWVAEDAWEQTLAAAQGSGTQPEITELNYAKVALRSQEGYYTALDDYMSESCFSDLLPNAEEMTNVNGKHYIYPWFVEPYSILFYRKSAFREAGLDPEKAPSSWDELYRYAQQLTTSERYGIQMPNVNQLGWVLWGFQAQDENSAGYYLVNEDWTQVSVNTDFHKALFTMFKNIYDEGLTPKVALSSYNEIKPLAQNRVAMDFGGSWSIGQIKNNYPDELDDIGYAPCPTIDGVTEGKTTAAMGGWGMAIDGKAAHPAECGKFIEWLLGSDVTRLGEFMQALGYSKFAARQSVESALASDESAQKDPFYKFVSEKILPYSKAEPIYEWELSKRYADALDGVTTLHQSVSASLVNLQDTLQSLVDAGGAGVNPFRK